MPNSGYEDKPTEASDSSLTGALNALLRVTEKLRFLGLVVALSTGAAIGSIANMLLDLRRSQHNFPDPFMLVCIPVACAIVAIIIRDSIKRHGESLFEEIADELQWQVTAGTKATDYNAKGARPPLEIRYALRKFAHSTDLPLVPGHVGPAIYAFINVGAFLTAAYFRYIEQVARAAAGY